MVPEIREIALNTALYVNALVSVTVSPDNDCDPASCHKLGFQALGSESDKFLIKNCLTRANTFKCNPPFVRGSTIGYIMNE